MAKKKAEDMRDELRQIISFAESPSAWQEASSTWKHKFVRIDRRQFTIEKERRRKAIEYSAITFMLLVLVGTIVWFFWFIMKAKGMI